MNKSLWIIDFAKDIVYGIIWDGQSQGDIDIDINWFKLVFLLKLNRPCLSKSKS